MPVTPSVMRWAVDESGYPLEELAAATGVTSATIESWRAGASQPSLTHLRALASKLKRPLAAFLLPHPPRLPVPALEFRRAPGEQRRHLNPDERRLVRSAARLQRVLSWINRELQRPQVGLPRASIKASAESAAVETRDRLKAAGLDPQSQPSSSAAFQWWRSALEQSGVFVLMLPMGAEACRGFSLWDDDAPLVAVNTAWSAEARTFTLFHEYGHLLTRTNSACLEGTHHRASAQSDAVERWCEQFAAAAILPLADLQQVLSSHGWQRGVTDVGIVVKIAKHFKASLRATTLRLIGLGVAGWELYRSLPPTADRKPSGGGGSGRDRTQVRHDQYGDYAMKLFAAALQREVVSGGDVLDYLDLSPQALAAGGGVESVTAESE